jgi:hypothetical protein
MTSRHREFVRDEGTGEVMQVVRPKSPQLAVELAKKAADSNDGELFQRLPGIVEDAAGEYTFMGYLARRASGQPCIVDAKGKFLAELAPGDSVVTGLNVAKP